MSKLQRPLYLLPIWLSACLLQILLSLATLRDVRKCEAKRSSGRSLIKFKFYSSLSPSLPLSLFLSLV